MSNPAKTRAIAEAKVKTDKVDAQILAQLLAADYLPAVWLPDAATSALRRQVLRRAHIVRARTRLKNQVHAILHRNLVPTLPGHGPVRAQGTAPGWPSSTCRRTSGPQRPRCCGSWTSTARSCALIDADLGMAALAEDEPVRRCAG